MHFQVRIDMISAYNQNNHSTDLSLEANHVVLVKHTIVGQVYAATQHTTLRRRWLNIINVDSTLMQCCLLVDTSLWLC